MMRAAWHRWMLASALLSAPAVALAPSGGGGAEGAAYQRGLELLDRGEDAEAAAAFAAAAAADDPAVRWRAWRNVAVAHLRSAASAAGEARRDHASAAAGAAMEALRLEPGSEGARRDLALARRILTASAPPRPVTGSDEGSRPITAASAGEILDALRSGEGSSAVRGIVAGTPGPGRDTLRRRGPPW